MKIPDEELLGLFKGAREFRYTIRDVRKLAKKCNITFAEAKKYCDGGEKGYGNFVKRLEKIFKKKGSFTNEEITDAIVKSMKWRERVYPIGVKKR